VSGPTEHSQATFEQLFRNTRSDLLAYILRRSRNAEDAADVLAETYLIAWQKLEKVPKGERTRLWLFGVARNLLMKGASRRHSPRSWARLQTSSECVCIEPDLA
jgi:DNA-directed RNA polymerase specialized sigma24 family protein